MRHDFIAAVRTHEKQFELELANATIERLADYYDLVQLHNPLLHLVGPCSPQEFATRHILESLTLIKFLPRGVRFADVGAGAGLPSIPCLIAREDLKGVLIESKEKKVKFLQTVVADMGMTSRVEIVARQFSETKLANVYAVTCRALDKFTAKLPQLAKWAKHTKLLLFGGNSLGEALDGLKIKHDRKKMPLSDQRYLFIER
jgi:16S rRNA (guanine527-N7)-methyltransferase